MWKKGEKEKEQTENHRKKREEKTERWRVREHAPQ